MTKRQRKNSQSAYAWLIIAVLIGLGSLIALLLRENDITLLNPSGLIAGEQARLMIVTMAVMLEIAIPTLIMFYFVAWKYRETNEGAVYDPQNKPGKLLIFTLWAVPSTIVVLLTLIVWPATNRLAPQKAIASDVKPLTIQVVALRWKWLFIYPEQQIATVNFIQIPTDTPVRFELTADEVPMSSFWIPHLGGQLYAMTGHVNQLNLIADTSGDYPGSSAEINGAGFAGMKFIARATSDDEFNSWVQEVTRSGSVLDAEEYAELLAPSKNNSSEFYSKVDTGLYDTILAKYTRSSDNKTEHE